MLSEFDIIALSEVKTTLHVRLPGYVTYQGKTVGTVDRGGLVVLVKNSLNVFLHSVDISIGDQVWLQVSIIKGVMFGFCYVPLCDSKYYSHDAFIANQERIMCNYMMRNGYINLDDMNPILGGQYKN